MSYEPNPLALIADGSIASVKLGVDITTLAKTLIVQSTTDAAKTTLEVVDGTNIPPYLF